MFGFLKTAVMSAFYRVREEVGQNLVETALIIGVVSVVIIGVITASDVDAQVQEVTEGIICTLSGGTWDPGTANTTGTGVNDGTCT